MIPGTADGDGRVSQSFGILVGEAATPVPSPELLLDNLFDVVWQSGLAQSCHDRRRFTGALNIRNPLLELGAAALADKDHESLC